MVGSRWDQINRLMKKNDQIKSIRMERPPKDYVNFINKQLLNLENLTLQEWSIGGNNITFQHVKHFFYSFPPNQQGYVSDSIKKLSFPTIESARIENLHLERNVFVGECDKFFRKHPSISKLHYINNYSSGDDLMDLESDLMNLTELTLECALQTDHEKIIKFIESHEKLINFKMSSEYINDNLLKRLEYEPRANGKAIHLKGYKWNVNNLK